MNSRPQQQLDQLMLIDVFARYVELAFFDVAVWVCFSPTLQHIAFEEAFLNASIAVNHTTLAMAQALFALAVVERIATVKFPVALR